MPIFYENFLKKTTTQYFEALNVTIEALPLSSIAANTTLDKIPEKQVYTQGNELYCVIRIQKYVYSFSFMSTSKSNSDVNSLSLALTFGLITNPSTVTAGEIAKATKMASYRDSSTKTNVGPDVFKILWEHIIGYYMTTSTYQSNKQMSYRADLEGHEHAVLSNLVNFLKKNQITKTEILDKLNKIKTKIGEATKYSDVAEDDGKTSYYAFSGSDRFDFERNKPETRKEKEEKDKKIAKIKMMSLVNEIEKTVKQEQSDMFTKKELMKLLEDFETKNFIRTGLYSLITKEFFGYRDVKKKIKSSVQAIAKQEKKIDEYLKEIKDTIINEYKVIINQKEKSIVEESEVNNLITDIKNIIESDSMDNNQKTAKIEEIVDNFYTSKIQNFSYLQNRYVLLQM